jgi:transposase
MKNKYIKHSHILEGKFREIIRLFCADLEATQIAELSKINRNTINRILQLLRERIAGFAEEESCFTSGEIEIDESYFGARRVRGKRGRGAGGKTKVFGMKKREGKVYTQIVNNCSAAELVPIIKRLAPDDATIYSALHIFVNFCGHALERLTTVETVPLLDVLCQIHSIFTL